MRFRTGIAISPTPADGPLLFAGRLEEGLRRAAELGFASVELSVRTADEVDRAWLTKRLEQLNLSVSGIATGQACLHDGVCLATTDVDRRAAALERLMRAVDLAAAVGASVIVGGIRGCLSGSEREQAKQRDAFHGALSRCATAAASAGVTLLLEPINRYETNFIRTAAEGLAVIETVGDDAIKLLLDSFHMNIEEASPGAAVRSAGERLGYLHLADNNRRAPGEGHIDFDALLVTAAEVGYRGPAIAEILPVPDDETAARNAAAFWAMRSSTHADPASERRRTMPRASIPADVQQFLLKAHPAVVATVRPDGSLATVATWYAWEDDRILLNMDESRRRLEWLRQDGRVSLTVIDRDDFYRHVSLSGQIETIEEDRGLTAIDRLALRYTNKPYRDRVRRRYCAWMRVDRWHGWNDGPWRR